MIRSVGMDDASRPAPAGAEAEMRVAHVRRDAHDRHGHPITEVYQRKRDLYAIYRTKGRVLVHFADDPGKSDEQRRALAPLLPLRDEIDGLVQGWRDADPDNTDAGTDRRGREGRGFFGLRDGARLCAKVRCQDRRVAGALVQALEDDVPGAQLLLQKIKSDVLNERIASGRFEYLLTAFGAALAAMFAAWLLASLLPSATPDPGDAFLRIGRTAATGLVLVLLVAAAGLAFVTAREEMSWRRAGLVFAVVAIPILAMLVWPATSTAPVETGYGNGVLMWRGFAAGAVGAFFSIAIAIRGRTVLPDLLRTANMLDAVLRVTVGAIGGAVLVALIEGGLVRFLAVEADARALVAGFVAGFAERLVPDLLAKVGEKPAEFDAQLAAFRAQREAGADRRAEARRDAAAPEPRAGQAAVNDNPPDDAPDDDVEVGPEGFRLGDDEKTQDEELPAATGGVRA